MQCGPRPARERREEEHNTGTQGDARETIPQGSWVPHPAPSRARLPSSRGIDNTSINGRYEMDQAIESAIAVP